MATKLKVTYADGRVVEVMATPRAQVMTEQHFKGLGDTNMLQAAYFLAWASLHRAGKEPTEYEPWLDMIADVEQVNQNGEAEEVDPTRTVPPSDSSSD